LALSPATILGRERINAGIDADVANKKLRALDKVRYLINGSPAETTCGSCHRRAPSLPSQLLTFGSQIRKWPNFDFGCAWFEIRVSSRQPNRQIANFRQRRRRFT
jgi:hypothetical protein